MAASSICNGKEKSAEGKTPFLIGVAGGTASGKVLSIPSFSMFALGYIFYLIFKSIFFYEALIFSWIVWFD